MQVSKFSLEDLQGMSLRLLSNLEVTTPEEEKLVQSIVNLKRASMPVEDVYRQDFVAEFNNETPDKEAEIQAKIDERKAKRAMLISSGQTPTEETPEVAEGTLTVISTEEVPAPTLEVGPTEVTPDTLLVSPEVAPQAAEVLEVKTPKKKGSSKKTK